MAMTRTTSSPFLIKDDHKIPPTDEGERERERDREKEKGEFVSIAKDLFRGKRNLISKPNIENVDLIAL